MRRKRNLTPMGVSSFGNLTSMGLMMLPQFPYLEISISRKKIHLYIQCPCSAEGIYHALCMEISEFDAMTGNITVASLEADFMPMSYMKCVHFIFKICALNSLGFHGLLCHSHFFLPCPWIFFFFSPR